MDIIYITVAAFMGVMVASLSGLLESQGAFQWKKFCSSLIRGLVAAAGFAIAYSYTDGISELDLVIAFVGGAGIDVLGNRGAGAIRALSGKGKGGV